MTERKGAGTRRPREIADAVRPIAVRVAEARGLMLWSVTFGRHAGSDVLSVAADRLGGVESGELAGMAEELSREIDQADAVPGDARYTLEVTSPGAERMLSSPEHFAVCVGRTARVATRDGREIEGKLEGLTDHGVALGTDEGSVRVAFSDIESAKLTVKGFGS